MIRTYSPQIEVRLIKTARRTELVPGVPVAARYGEITGIDLTPYLAEGEPVTIRQQLGGAGSWSLTLVDRMMPDEGETLYAMIEANDIIEIRMARSPHEYGHSGLPVVLRGFVSSIDRTRSNMGGHPHRRVHLAGSDFSKILDIIRIYYLNNSVVGDNILTELGFFEKYASLSDAKIMSAKEFAELVLDKVINPFIARLTRNSTGVIVGAQVLVQLEAEVTIEGTVSPLSVALFNDGSVRSFLSQFLDVGAFNEMFVDDRDTTSVLVIRPNRFVDLHGHLIQETDAALEDWLASIVDVPAVDIESISEGRTDAGVANYFWVNNFGWQIRDTIEVSQLAAAGNKDDYALMEYENASAARFGFRKMEVSSALGPPGGQYGDALQVPESKVETDRLIAWLTERRRILAEQNKDNAVLEDGQMTIAGNERVRRGGYVRAAFGGGDPSLHYVTAVTHSFVPFGPFKTSVSFERGTGFAARAQRQDAQYQSERNMKGTA
jgi:hypothetical protein